MKGEREIEISKIFPIQEITDRFLINGNGDITFGYHLRLPEVYTLGISQYEKIHNSLVAVLRDLVEGCSIHKQDIYYTEPFDYDKTAQKTYTEKRDKEHFHLKPQLQHYTKVFFTFSNKINGRKQTSSNNSLFRLQDYIFKEPLKDIEKNIESALKKADTFKAAMQGVDHTEIEEMSKEDILESLSVSWNLNPEDKDPSYNLQPLTINQNGLKIGNKNVGIVTLTNEGETTEPSKSPDLLSPELFENGVKYNTSIDLPTSFTLSIGLGLPINHIVNTIIEAVDQEQILKELRKEKSSLNFLTAVRYASAEGKVFETEEFLDQLKTGGYKTCLLKQNIICWDTDYNKLNTYLDNAKIAFTKMNGCESFIENMQTGNLFLGSIPGNTKANFRALLSTIGQASCFLPLETHIHSDVNGLIYHDRFGRAVTIDLKETDKIINRNKLVFGPSGSGKSFFLNHKASDDMKRGYHIIVMDKGGSFKETFKINKGYYVDTNNPQELKFNIFLVPKDKDGNHVLYSGDDESNDDKVNFLLVIFEKLWKNEGDTINSNEEPILRKIFPAFYEWINKTKKDPNLNLFHQFLEVYEKELMDERDKPFIAIHSLRNALTPYITGGEYEHFLNSKENLNLNLYKYIGFDLEGIENNKKIYSIVSFMVMELATNKIMNLPASTPKMFLVDEAVDFLEGNTGHFVAGIARKIRKKGGELVIATQSVGFMDNVDKMVADSILKNADTKILLGLGGEESNIKEAKKFLSLTDSDMKLIDTLKGREFFMKLGRDAYVFELKVSPESAMSFSTSPKDIDLKKKYIEKYKDPEVAIDQIIEDENN